MFKQNKPRLGRLMTLNTLIMTAFLAFGCSTRQPAPLFAFEYTNRGTPVGMNLCGPLTVYVSMAYSSVQKSYIDQALDIFDADLRIGPFDESASPSTSAITLTVANLSFGYSAYTQVGEYKTPAGDFLSSATISLTPKILTFDEADIIATILHELGHAAGLSDVANPRELMFERFSQTRPLTYAAGDLAGLNALRPRCFDGE